VWAAVGAATSCLVGGMAAYGVLSHRSATREAARAFSDIASRAIPPASRFDPKQVEDLPEIARRYFNHSIARGAPLYSVAELEMKGRFLLGDSENFQTYEMSARQALRPPEQFVWIPKMRSALMTISGSDALVEREAWTRFWLFGLVPVAQDRTSPDLVRSAQFRAVVEGALWLPASLLPEHGVHWEQLGQNEARVTFRRFKPEIVLHLKIDQAGAVREVVGQRWSNANRQKVFKLQPFGGTVSAERSFQGYTIPSEVTAGNHYGTSDYLPFFQAEIIQAVYR
jgi:hypothetical protein